MKRLARHDSPGREPPYAHAGGGSASREEGRTGAGDGDDFLVPGHRYGRKSSPGALLAIIAAHALALTALLTVGYGYAAKPPASRLATFDISEPPPPPPPPPQKLVEPKPSEPSKIVAPPSRVAMPSLNPVVTTPEPPEREVQAIAVQVPVETPAPAGPPAPVVPPDFTAGQLNNPGPSYPYLSRKAREEGVVMLKVRVGTDGRAKSVTLHNSSGHDRLDDAAMKTVRKWRFVPAKQAGQPVEAWVLVPVTFRLN